MHLKPHQPSSAPIEYPDSDGMPLADNTLQLDWIVRLYSNLAALYRADPSVFVGSDLLWYPVQGSNEERQAPDALLAFGRPKGYRGSYKQWEEDNIPITVAFEVLSPGNTKKEMTRKRLFYEEHGVEEYYLIDPDHHQVEIYLRKGTVFRRLRDVERFVSPRLGIRFAGVGTDLVVLGPDGKRFLSPEENADLQQQLIELAAVERKSREKAEKARDEARQRFQRLAQLSRKARQGQATPEELGELERLEEAQLRIP